MDKKAQTVIKYLIYLYLIIFPLGKLARLTLLGFSVDSVDLIVLLIAFITPFASLHTRVVPNWLKAFISFWVWVIFSLICSNLVFGFGWEKLSLFYFIRLTTYLLLPWAAYISINNQDKKNMVQLMLIDIFIISILGWLQYFIYPDLRQLKALGWDDHLNRLVSTFLDPAFTGIILVLGFILGYFSLKNIKIKLVYLQTIFISLLFTYSRASYLSLFLVFFGFLLYKSKKTIFLLVSMYILTLLLLPRPGGSGAELERLHSINLKIQNYKESMVLINSSPLVGFGFNNLCLVKENLLTSHSCYGLDNSFLFIIATTGIMGLIFYFEIIRQLLYSTAKNTYGRIFVYSVVALTFHTLFTNTFFYNFVLGWLALLIAISRSSTQSK